MLNPPTTILRSLAMLLLSILCLSGVHGNTHAGALINPSVVAVPNTIDDTDSIYTIEFTPLSALSTDYVILLEFPVTYSAVAFDALTGGDVDVTHADITGYSVSFPNVADENTIQIILTTSAPVTTPITIEVGSITNPLTNPSNPGLYGINISTYDDLGDFLDNGIVFAEIQSTVPITATITESLIMTLSNAFLNYSMDPGVNDGQDNFKTTLISVVTNAALGYTIAGRLEDGNNVAALTSGTDSIASRSAADAAADIGGNYNYFGYSARNADTIAEMDAEHGFSNVSTTLTADGINEVYGNNPTQEHSIRYDLNIDYLQAPGTYTGTVTYTVSATF